MRSSSSNASHTFTAGKTPLRALRCRLFHYPFDAVQDQLTRRAAFSRGYFVKAPVQSAGKVDAGADRISVHQTNYRAAAR
jgi:hypothetical protein